MQFYWLLLGILGVWQITYLLHAEDGPWQSLQRLRAWLTGLGLGSAVACFYCLSIWVALPIALWIGESWSERILLWLALAGAASLLERASQSNASAAAVYFEDAPTHVQEAAKSETEGSSDVQLREQEPAGGSTLRPGSIVGGDGRRTVARRDRDD